MATSGKKINQRQAKLKRERAKKTGVIIWRSLIAFAILGGLGWVLTQPNWIIRENSQIDIEGNHILSEDAVRSLISLSYPQSIFKIPVPQLKNELESLPPLAKVDISRQLFPPRINLNVKEKIPVAIVLDNSSPQKAIGFIDQEGIFLPENFYSSVKEEFVLPKIRITGFKEENRSEWSKLYQIVSESPIEIQEIDGRDSNNLILLTKLGKIYLGSNHNILLEQLKVLEQMGNLPSKVKIQEIDYIDLTDPANPLIQVFEVKSKVNAQK
jgi:cell division protein FtsQ